MADQFTPPLLDPVDPDSALADLEQDFQQSAAPAEIVVVRAEPPPIGRSWSFDFPRQRFRVASGAHAPLTTNGVATLVQWAEKCLHTTRGAHPIHPPGYGLRDRNALIGQTIAGAPVAELETRVREALTFHPRITDIQDFSYDLDESDEWIAVSFTMVLDDTVIPTSVALAISQTEEF